MGQKNHDKHVVPRWVQKKTSIKALSSSGLISAVVDFSNWLHSAMFACAAMLEKGDNDAALVVMCMYFRKRIQMLQTEGIQTLHFVRDGADLPAKFLTKQAREARAAANSSASHTKREPWMEDGICRYFDGCNKVQQFSTIKVTWEVALFEADAQIVHLLNLGYFHFAIANDQDFSVFGARRVASKLGRSPNKLNECDFLDTTEWKGKIPLCQQGSCTHPKSCGTCGKAVGLDRQGVLLACVLAGTDYYPDGLKNVAISTACDLIKKHCTIEAAVNAKLKIFARTNTAEAKHRTELLNNLHNARDTFLYQYVRTPTVNADGTMGDGTLSVDNITPAPPGVDTAGLSFLGSPPTVQVADDIAKGLRDPNPLQQNLEQQQ